MSQSAAIAFVLSQEGGALVRNPGLSRWGIDLSRHPELSEIDIENMTQATAGSIYAGPEYWGAIHGDQLPAFLQLPMLDACVNQGASAATKVLQHALGITADGMWGPATAAAVARIAPEFIAQFTAARVMAYTQDIGWADYGLGWTRRAVRAALEA